MLKMGGEFFFRFATFPGHKIIDGQDDKVQTLYMKTKKMGQSEQRSLSFTSDVATVLLTELSQYRRNKLCFINNLKAAEEMPKSENGVICWLYVL